MSLGRLLALTEEIYDAAAGGTPWTAVGGGLKALVGARSASLMAGDFLAGRAEILCHAEIPEEAATAYRQHYRHVDLWTNRAVQALARGGPGPLRSMVSGDMLVPDAEFLRSEFYCDFGRRYGLRYVVGTVVQLGEAGAMPIGLHQPEGTERFGAAERRLLDAVLPHLRRALQLRHRLDGVAAAGAAPPGTAALDALSMGVLVVDADLRVLVANAAAEALTAGAGAALRLRRAVGTGRGGAAARATIAEAGHRGDRAALGELVRATALGGRPGGALRLRDADSMPALAALVMPLPKRLSDAPGAGMGRTQDRALVLLREVAPSPAAPRADLLRGLFGLTRAEAEVARALSGGATKRAVADARGLREATVRTQVRAILEKTGAANLRDLERLLAGLHGM